VIVKETDSNKFHDTYDYVIVGAGIGGLVIANYLAREKYKVLVLEQHYLVGGCCTTFSVGRQYYNAAACHLANMGEGQPFRELLKDLECLDDLNFRFFDENDAVLFRDKKEDAFFISPSIPETADRFCNAYPSHSKDIKVFFSDFFSPRFMFSIFGQSKALSFKELLISYKIPVPIIEIFDALFLAYYTRTTDQTHPYAAKLLLENTIFSTRAMPKDNQLQSLSNLLANKFLRNGGHLKLSTDICKFKMTNEINITEAIDVHNNVYRGQNFIANTAPDSIIS
jgi:phytoene dehydrogenase-like protein